jgi:hypothetical protein
MKTVNDDVSRSRKLLLPPLFRLRLATVFKRKALNDALKLFPAGDRKHLRPQLWLLIQALVDAGGSVDVVVRSALPLFLAKCRRAPGKLSDQISDVIRDVGHGHAAAAAWLMSPFVALARDLWTHTPRNTSLSHVVGEALIHNRDRSPITSAQRDLEECERLDSEYQSIVSYMGSVNEDDYLDLCSMNVGYPPSGCVDHWRRMVAAHDSLAECRATVESWSVFERQVRQH